MHGQWLEAATGQGCPESQTPLSFPATSICEAIVPGAGSSLSTAGAAGGK